MIFSTSIYAETDKLNVATETYLRKYYNNFFEKLITNQSWDVYFNNNIHQIVSFFFDIYMHYII